MKRSPLMAAALAGALGSAAAQTVTVPPTHRTLVASCAGCHGTHGQGAGAMPALAGLPADHLATALRGFRDGKRPASVMHQLAKGYADDEIAPLAAHFARLPRAAGAAR
jgi:cytochrome c553